jgi:hypothetical protein
MNYLHGSGAKLSRNCLKCVFVYLEPIDDVLDLEDDLSDHLGGVQLHQLHLGVAREGRVRNLAPYHEALCQ